MKKIFALALAFFTVFPLVASASPFPPFRIEQGGTGGAGPWSLYPLVGAATSSLIASSTLWLTGINATSTSADSTFIHFTDTFGTTTNATTTNLFSTTASSTNLFTSSELIGTTSQSQSSVLSIKGNVFSSGTIYANNFFDTSVSGSTCVGETNGLLGTSNCVSSLASANGSLTISSPTGAVDSSINLGHTNIWTILQDFNAGIIVNSASSTFAGSLFITGNSTTTSATTTNMFSTTASSTNLFTQNLQANITIYQSFTAPTTTWSGTTTKPLQTAYKAEIWNSAACFTDAGTLNVDFYHGSTHIKTPDTKFNASSTNNINVFNTGNILTVGDKVYVDLGTPASTPTVITCTISKTLISN